MLLRRFIGQRLSSYYAQEADRVVSSLPSSEPIEFHRLLDEWQWKRLLDRMYRDQNGQWFTPVELFKPYYSIAMANFIATHCRRKGSSSRSTAAEPGEGEVAVVEDDFMYHDEDMDYYEDGPIEIVELGGGRGTNALCVLNHLQEYEPDLYQRIQYYILDSSPTLHKLQQHQLKASSHADRVSFVLKDLTEAAEGRTELLPPMSDNYGDDRLTFVIALEVFDNLPHDKVKSTGGGGQGGRALERHQCIVRNDLASSTASKSQDDKKNNTINRENLWQECFEPLSDPLLSQMLKVAPTNYLQPNSATWVPTVALALLHQLPKYRPSVQLLIADFDWFPDPSHFNNSTQSSTSTTTSTQQQTQPPPRRSLMAHQEPLIKAMDESEYDVGVPYECYLTAPLLSDILFPTSFPLVSQFLTKSWKKLRRDVVVQKQADFLWHYAPDEVKKTQSWLTGYSPLLDDYSNMSVLTATFPRQTIEAVSTESTSSSYFGVGDFWKRFSLFR